MRPKGFLLSVNPSSSKETAKVINGYIIVNVLGVYLGSYIIGEGES